MHISRETKILDFICFGLILLACGFNILSRAGYFPFSENNIVFAIYAAAVLIWSRHIRRRMVYWKAKQYLSWSAILMVVLIGVRALRYMYFTETFFLRRYLWYIYCFFIIFIALFQFFAVLYIGKTDHEEIDRRWRLLYIPAAVLFLLIMTNDLHERAFVFTGGFENRTDNFLRPRIVFYLSMAFVVLLIIFTLITVFIRCDVLKKRKNFWIPLIPVAIGIFYTAVNIIPEDIRVLGLFRYAFTISEITCFAFAAFTECLILSGLFPSNDRYVEFFDTASLGIGIMDNNGAFIYVSEKSPPVTPEQVRNAENETVRLSENTVLRSHSISGGMSYHIKDVGEINRLTRELTEYVDLLQEENSILDAENQFAENRIRILEQNRLYNAIASDIRKQTYGLEILLRQFDENEDRNSIMAYASVLVAYIKRRANLMLLSNQNKRILSDELSLAIAESLEAVRICGTICAMNIQKSVYIPSEAALLVYETVEEVIESTYADTNALMIHFTLLDDTAELRIEADTSGRVTLDTGLQQKASALNGTLKTERENGTVYIILSLPAGGDIK